RSNGGRLNLGPTLQGRSAVVTGGSGGIGGAIAQALARARAALTLLYHARRPRADAVVARIEAAGGTALAVQADLRDKAGVSGLFARHQARFGGVHILVNNAGDMVRRMPTVEAP